MNQIKYLDKSTRLLILVSVAGIVSSVFVWLFFDYFHSFDQGTGEFVADLRIYKNDARVKRSGNVHWFPINRDLDCFQNDLIFTGEDSIAGVEYPKGDSVLLAPNTLISLSAGRVVLESGSIDVNLSGAGNFEIESFGKVMAFSKPGKLKIVNTAEEKSLTALEGDLLSDKAELRAFTITPPLKVLTPSAASAFPRLKQSKVNIEWVDTTPAMARDQYKLEFSQTKAFREILSSHVLMDTKFSASAGDFPNGTIFYRIVAKHAPHANHILESFFVIHSQYEIEHKTPEDFSSYPFNDGAASVLFSWNDPIKKNNRFQIAKDHHFRKIVNEGESSNGEYSLMLKEPGEYYWRVGHIFEQEVVWSKKISRFDLLENKKIHDIYLKNIENEFDFAVAKVFTILIKDDNNANNYRIILKREDKIINEVNINNNKYQLNKLSDGKYTIQVFAELENGIVLESKIYQFRVKTSKPLEAPKVKSQPKNIFVRVWDFIFPSAHATELIFVEWERDDSDAYEIEVLSEGKVVHSRTITNSNHNIPIKRPGTYTWRTRRKKGKLWSDFSKEVKIVAKDKVLTIEDPLMLDSAELDYANKQIIFSWTEPYPDLKYYLEIYNADQVTPIETIEVTGGKHRVNFFDEPGTYRWRVYAKSPYGTATRNGETLRFNISDRELFNASAEFSYVSSSQKQEIVSGTSLLLNRTNNFTGYSFLGSYERRASLWNINFDGEFSFRFTDLADGGNTYASKDFMLELGVPLLARKKASHYVYLGGQLSLVDLNFTDRVTYTYLFNYGSTRYKYVRNLTNHLALVLGAKGLLFIDIENPRVSLQLKGGLNYKIKPNLVLQGYAGLERNTVFAKKVKGSVSGDLDISNNIFSAGARLFWLY